MTNLTRALVLLVLVCLGVVPAWAGPIILAGHDADEHGFHSIYAGLFNALLQNVTNGQSGILAIGADPGTTAGGWIATVASLMSPAQTVTFVNGSDISSIDFSQFAILHVPSDSADTFGGITPAENALLVARARDVADFVNAGGGLFGLTQGQFADAYGYLSFFGTITSLSAPPSGVLPSGELYDNVTTTAAGQAVGMTDANIDGCCWHNVFTVFPAFLAVLATANEPADPPFHGQAAVLGGTTVRVSPPAFGAAGGAGRPWGVIAEPVNTATGNYIFQRTDVTLPGRGLPVVFTRTYNALDNVRGPLGRGWTHAYNIRLTETPGGPVVIRQGDGQEEIYDPIGGGSFTARFGGVFSVLAKNADGTFVLTLKNQTRYHFSASGKLTSIADRTGNALTFTYDGTGNLVELTDTVGRSIALLYDASNRLTELTDPAGRRVLYSYDPAGNLVSVTDLNGGVMDFVYDANGRLTEIHDAQGHRLVLNVYDTAGRVATQTNARGFTTTFAYGSPGPDDTTITDPLGNAIIHTHDDLLRLTQATDALSNTMRYAYDADNNRTSITDQNGNVTAFTYDANGNVTAKTDPLGNTTTIAYDALNNPTRRVDALGHVTTYSYDAVGNLTRVTDPLGNNSSIAYDGFGQPTILTDARGNTTTNTFDAHGNLVTLRDALGNETTFIYDGVGRRTSVTDANGHTTAFVYDNNNNLLQVTDPLGNATIYAYDANNNRTSITDPQGNTTAFAYDENDLLLSTTDPLGNTTTYAYDEVNNRVAVTDARGNTTQYDSDATNRLIQVTDALGNATRYAYDANGNLLTQTNALGHTASFTYDALNRLLTTTDTLGNTTRNTYDALGRLTQVTDANGRLTQYAYDALGRLVQVTDPAGGTASYTYDAVGNRTAITDPNGNTTPFTYDALNRLAAKADPLGNIYTYAYDGVGNRTQLTDAKGNLLRYTYDANNRLSEIRYPDGSRVTFGYDAAGNRTQMADTLSTSTYQYDALNRLAQYTDPFGKTVGYAYDQVGNRATLTYPDGKRVAYTYDALNRMQTVTDWLGGVTTYSYDAARNLASTRNPNGTTATYTYDTAERLTGLANAKANGSVIASYGLTLDPVGNRTHINRVEPLAPVFRKKTVTHTYDDDNRLLTVNGSPVPHDANGNLTAKNGTTYAYDFEDRLLSVTGSTTAQYRYDGIGNRLVATRGGQTTRYTLDVAGPLSNVLVESDGAGSQQALYVYGLGLISRITPAGEPRYYQYDPIGSAVALTDGGGTVTDAYVYDPFGEVIDSLKTVQNPFLYVGQFGVIGEGNGLQFMRARYYDSLTGRFLKKDTLAGDSTAPSTLNKYLYGQNNPLTFVDPTGFWSWQTFWGGAASGFAESIRDFSFGLLDLVQAGIEFTVPEPTLVTKTLGIAHIIVALDSFNNSSKAYSAGLQSLVRAIQDKPAIFSSEVPGPLDPLLSQIPGFVTGAKALTLANSLQKILLQPGKLAHAGRDFANFVNGNLSSHKSLLEALQTVTSTQDVHLARQFFPVFSPLKLIFTSDKIKTFLEGDFKALLESIANKGTHFLQLILSDLQESSEVRK